MTTQTLLAFVAALVTAWCIGFGAGFIVTRFKEAMNQIS